MLDVGSVVGSSAEEIRRCIDGIERRICERRPEVKHAYVEASAVAARRTIAGLADGPSSSAASADVNRRNRAGAPAGRRTSVNDAGTSGVV